MNRSNQSHSSRGQPTRKSGLKRPAKVAPLELTMLEDVNIDGEGLDIVDPNFKSELEYDGYHNIEAYDNHTFNANELEDQDPEEELNFDEE